MHGVNICCLSRWQPAIIFTRELEGSESAAGMITLSLVSRVIARAAH